MRMEKKETVKVFFLIYFFLSNEKHFYVSQINFISQGAIHFMLNCSDFSIVFLQGEQFVYYEDWGEALVSKSCPVLCVLDIEGDNVSVLEGVPDNISPGQVCLKVWFVPCLFLGSFGHAVNLFLSPQAFWAPGDTGVVFVGWWHEPFRLGLKYCPNRRCFHFTSIR